MDNSTFIFGYGSLIWKADFPYKNRSLYWYYNRYYPVYIEDFVRRFWQYYKLI